MALGWTSGFDVAGTLCVQPEIVRLREAARGRGFCGMVAVEGRGVGGCIDDICAGIRRQCCGVKRL